MQNKIKKSELKKYYDLTKEALEIAKKSVIKNKIEQANEIFTMVEAYLSDSKYFEKNGNYVLAYGALNYAHGWLDAGARLKIYKVNNSRLFAA